MDEQNQRDKFNDTDILEIIEFDLTEAIKDLICNIKLIKQEVDTIKEYLPIKKV